MHDFIAARLAGLNPERIISILFMINGGLAATVGSSDNILKAMQNGSLNCIVKRQNVGKNLIINIIKDLVLNKTIPKKVVIGNEVIF